MGSVAETLWVVPGDTIAIRALAATGSAAVWRLEELAERLAAVRRPARRVLGDVGAWLAVAAATDDGSPLGAEAFERLGGLVDAVAEARAARVRSRALSGIAGRTEDPARTRLLTVARALDAFERLLHGRGLADGPGRWDDARAALAASNEWPAPLEPFRRVVVTLHPPLPAVTLDALVALAALAERAGRAVTVEVPCTGQPTLDAAVEPLFAAFEAHPELSPLTLERRGGADGPLALAVERLGEPGEDAGRLSLWSASGGAAEVRALAEQARRAVRGGALPPRCAVIVPDAALADAAAAAMTAAGLPVGRRPGRLLGTTAAGRAGLLAARLAEARFPAAEVAWLLGSGLVPGLAPAAPPGVATLLERAGIGEGIPSGPGQSLYEERLDALARRDARRSEAARALLESCRVLFAVLGELPLRGALAAHLEAWQRALSALGFWEAPAGGALPSRPGASGALRAAAREVQAREGWRWVVREARGSLAALGVRGPELDRAGFAAWLAAVAARHSLPPEAGHPGGIAVLLLEEAPEHGAFEWIGAVGLSDGRFPRQLARAGALTDDDRWLVNRALGRDAFPLRFGAGDVRPPAAHALDGWRLGLGLGRAGSASLGFARDDGFRDVAGPASFLELLARSAGVERVDFPPEPAPPLERAASEGELRVALALASGGASVDPVARALAADLHEAWLVEAQAMGDMEKERVRAFEDPGLPSGRFSGTVPGETAAALRSVFAFGPDAPLSASTLGRLAQCAFQGFARIALRLEEPDAPGESLDARSQGSFWHMVLEHLFPSLKAAGKLGLPAQEVPAELIDAAISAAALDHRGRFSPGHARLFALARERARWMVRRILDAPHHGLPFEGLLPEEEEARFGRRDSLDAWREVRLPGALPGEGELFLTGAVDRLDGGPGSVGILDYKVNRRREAARDLLRTDFQLPFYLHAVRSRGERRSLRAGWLVLRTGEFQPFDWAAGAEGLLATDAAARERARAGGLPNLANAVHALVQRAWSGDFGARSEDCGFCPFGSVCRIGERRRGGSRW